MCIESRTHLKGNYLKNILTGNNQDKYTGYEPQAANSTVQEFKLYLALIIQLIFYFKL
jgi:hypothetical protein